MPPPQGAFGASLNYPYFPFPQLQGGLCRVISCRIVPILKNIIVPARSTV